MGKPESRMRRNSKSDASSSQARLQDAYLGGLIDTATGKPCASSKSDCQGGPKAEKERMVTQSTRVSSHNSPYAVFSIVREIYEREHDDLMDDLDVNIVIWCIYLNATLRTAVHLGQDYEANLRYVKNNLWNSVGLLFRETGKLISEKKEITGVSTIRFKDATWMSTSLLCENGLSDHQCQSLRLLRLCALCGNNGRRSYCNLEEQN